MEDEGQRGVYIISVAAELVGVHPQTLRIYERKGLLTPSRTAGNTRRYSERDIARLQTIQRLTQEGVNLAGVKMIVEMENELDRLRERMQLMREQMRQAEERVRREVDRVRREFRAEIVPLSDMRSAQQRLRGGPAEDARQSTAGAPGAAGRRRAIPLGPVASDSEPHSAPPNFVAPDSVALDPAAPHSASQDAATPDVW